MTGALAVGMPPQAIRPWRRAITARAPWEEAAARASKVMEQKQKQED